MKTKRRIVTARLVLTRDSLAAINLQAKCGGAALLRLRLRVTGRTAIITSTSLIVPAHT